jgi:ABC-2 type transport system ATP-binding protein
MTRNVIEAVGLTKEYRVREVGSGVAGTLRSLLRPIDKTVQALQGVSFQVKAGEMVGYLGRNGAGKSTTIKILTGILHPTSGTATVAGLSPQRERIALAGRIGVLFGQRTQLYWDLPLADSLELKRRMYAVDRTTFSRRAHDLTKLLGIADLLPRPVRQLSLGQRMCAELCASVLHHPEILFLDEPTIGLDVDAKQAVRRVVRDLNRTLGTTIILTSHDLQEVERLCERLIIIDGGTIVADDTLDALTRTLTPYRLVRVAFDEARPEIEWPGTVVTESGPGFISLRVDTKGPPISEFLSYLASRVTIRDLTIGEPALEDVVGEFYGRGALRRT